MSARSNRMLSAIVLGILLIFTLLFMVSIGRAQTVVFSDAGKASATVQQQLAGATGSIHVAMFSFTDRALAGALTNAAARHVDVRLVADQSQSLGGGSCVPWLLQALGSNRVQTLRGRVASGIMHDKFAVLDGHTVLTGSFNWTTRADKCNWENFVILKDAAVAQRFEQEFATLQKAKP